MMPGGYTRCDQSVRFNIRGSLPVSLLQHALESRLAPVVARAGFLPTDSSESRTAEAGEAAWLEYRAEYADRRVLLDIYQVAARRTVSAILWSPADLARVDHAAGVPEIALRARTWHYEASMDRDALA